jgi:hypothetical protein
VSAGVIATAARIGWPGYKTQKHNSVVQFEQCSKYVVLKAKTELQSQRGAP